MKTKKGFTLIELMVVMAIIAVLSVLIIGAIQIARKSSVETANRGSGKTIQTGMEAYYAKYKAYPTAGTYTFDALEGGALNGLITLQGSQCTSASTYKDGGNVVVTATGYTVYVADNLCTSVLDTW